MTIIGETSFDDIRADLIENFNNLTPYLIEAFSQAGIIWEQVDAKIWETKLGMRLQKNGNKILVLDVHPSSPAEDLGFWRGDQLLQWDQSDPKSLLTDESIKNVENIEIQWIKHGEVRKSMTPKGLSKTFYTQHKLKVQD